MNLEGKGILITGASQGLGKTIAAACLTEGANVLLCARSSDLLEQTRRELSLQTRPKQILQTIVADVSQPAAWERLAEAVAHSLPGLDGLVNNAGVYGPIGPIEEVDWNDWVQAIEVNLMGTVLACRTVLPIFRRQGHGKIVNISGGGATKPLPRFSAYAASKAAVVRFTETLAEENRGAGIDANALAPGALNTRMLDELLAAGPEKVGQALYGRSIQQKEQGGASLETAANLCIFLLSDASNGISGKLISAPWDPWQMMPERRAELDGSDIYTLRRIESKDRGKDW